VWAQIGRAVVDTPAVVAVIDVLNDAEGVAS
jgi:hypothetical protein